MRSQHSESTTQRGSTGRRIAAALIDLAVVPFFVYSGLFLLLLDLPRHAPGLSHILFGQSDGSMQGLAAILLSPLPVTLIQTYWLRQGRTIGKTLLGLRVVRQDGSHAGFRRMFARQSLQFAVLFVLTSLTARLRIATGLTDVPDLAAIAVGFLVPPAILVTLLAARHWTPWDYLLRTDVVHRATSPRRTRSAVRQIPRPLAAWAVALIIWPAIVWLSMSMCSSTGTWISGSLLAIWLLCSIYGAARVSWSQLTPRHGCLFSLGVTIVAFGVASLGALWVYIFWFGAALGCSETAL